MRLPTCRSWPRARLSEPRRNRETGAGQNKRPAVRDQPLLNVFAIDGTFGDRAAEAIEVQDVAGPALLVGMVDQRITRGSAAGPALAFVVQAQLVGRRRIDAGQPDFGACYLQRVAVVNFRESGNVGGVGGNRQGKYREKYQESGNEFHRGWPFDEGRSAALKL